MKETFKNLKRVYKHGKKFKKNLIIFTIITISNIAINIIYPIFTAKQIVALSGSLYMDLLIASLVCFGMGILCDFTTVILRKNTQIFFRGTTKSIQMEASKQILEIELSSIDKSGSGTFIQRITYDTDDMSRVFTRGMSYLSGIITDIGIFVAVFIISKVVFAYLLFCSIVLTLLYLITIKHENIADKKYRTQKEKTNSLIGELVRGIRDIKMLYAKNSFVEEVDENIDKLTQSQFNLRNVEIKYNCITDIVYNIFELLLILLFIYLLSHNLLTAASALVLYNYRTRILDNLIQNTGWLLEEIRNFNLACTRVFSIIDDNDFKKEKFGKDIIEHVDGNFEFKDVHFGYNETEVLKGMSFKIKANETVAFVGRSGVGKTTIFSLLCKLYHINSGNIYIDGIDIDTLDERSIRNNITIISQNPYIFNMSIKDNFKLVKKDVTDEEIVEACHLACLDDFIKKLPEGYDTVVGEGGITLSGGERQRLAIARAFIQNTKIILFDEATSALDNETQKNIQQAINNMKDKYTILIIAHRLSTIVSADKIIVVSNGKVVAKGTHKKLLESNKLYKKLYESEIVDE